MIKKLYLLLVLLSTVVGVSAAPQKHTHLYAVKDADSLYLDHYVAPIEGERPCMMFVFGGGFVTGERDKEWYLPYFEFLTDNGYDVVSIDYRLGLKPLVSGGATASMRDMIGMLHNAVKIAVEDLFSATLFIIENAEQWQIDTDRIVTSGSSAGAITVIQAENAICNNTRQASVLPQGFRYAGVVSFAGALFSVDGKPKWGVPPAPMMFFHGSADRQVPYNKATMLGVGFFGPKYLVAEFEEQKWPYWFYDIEYHTHEIAGLPMMENHNEILTFLEKFVTKREPLMIHTQVRDQKLEKCETKFKIKDYIEANFPN